MAVSPVRSEGKAAAAARAAAAQKLGAMAQDLKSRCRERGRSHAPPRDVEHATARHAGEVIVRGEIAVEAQALGFRALLYEALRGQPSQISIDGAQAHPREAPPDFGVH